jgi:hypothetical protein
MQPRRLSDSEDDVTEWMLMKKDGIDEAARVTRESFRLCHEPHGWVEYIPPAPDPVDDAPQDGQPPADEPNESTQDSAPTTPRRRSAAKE